MRHLAPETFVRPRFSCNFFLTSQNHRVYAVCRSTTRAVSRAIGGQRVVPARLLHSERGGASRRGASRPVPCGAGRVVPVLGRGSPPLRWVSCPQGHPGLTAVARVYSIGLAHDSSRRPAPRRLGISLGWEGGTLRPRRGGTRPTTGCPRTSPAAGQPTAGLAGRPVGSLGLAALCVPLAATVVTRAASRKPLANRRTNIQG